MMKKNVLKILMYLNLFSFQYIIPAKTTKKPALAVKQKATVSATEKITTKDLSLAGTLNLDKSLKYFYYTSVCKGKGQINTIDSRSTPNFTITAFENALKNKPYLYLQFSNEITDSNYVTTWQVYDNDGNPIDVMHGSSTSSNVEKGDILVNYLSRNIDPNKNDSILNKAFDGLTPVVTYKIVAGVAGKNFSSTQFNSFQDIINIINTRNFNINLDYQEVWAQEGDYDLPNLSNKTFQIGNMQFLSATSPIPFGSSYHQQLVNIMNNRYHNDSTEAGPEMYATILGFDKNDQFVPDVSKVTPEYYYVYFFDQNKQRQVMVKYLTHGNNLADSNNSNNFTIKGLADSDITLQYPFISKIKWTMPDIGPDFTYNLPQQDINEKFGLLLMAREVTGAALFYGGDRISSLFYPFSFFFQGNPPNFFPCKLVVHLATTDLDNYASFKLYIFQNNHWISTFKQIMVTWNNNPQHKAYPDDYGMNLPLCYFVYQASWDINTPYHNPNDSKCSVIFFRNDGSTSKSATSNATTCLHFT
jgi:hypothetical protein